MYKDDKCHLYMYSHQESFLSDLLDTNVFPFCRLSDTPQSYSAKVGSLSSVIDMLERIIGGKCFLTDSEKISYFYQLYKNV